MNLVEYIDMKRDSNRSARLDAYGDVAFWIATHPNATPYDIQGYLLEKVKQIQNENTEEK